MRVRFCVLFDALEARRHLTITAVGAPTVVTAGDVTAIRAIDIDIANGKVAAAFWADVVGAPNDTSVRARVYDEAGSFNNTFLDTAPPLGDSPETLEAGVTPAGLIAGYKGFNSAGRIVQLPGSGTATSSPFLPELVGVSDMATDDAGNSYWVTQRSDDQLRVEILRPNLSLLRTIIVDAEINADLVGDPDAQIAVDRSSGRFAVTYVQFNTTTLAEELRLRQFDSTGTPQSTDVAVNLSTQTDPKSPDVAIDALGRTIVAWRNVDGDVFARRFNANGVAAAASVTLATQTARSNVAVVANGAGDHVVLWQAGANIVGRQFFADGTLPGIADFTWTGPRGVGSNGYTNGTFNVLHDFAAAMSSSGRLVLAVSDVATGTATSASTPRQIYAQRFDFVLAGPLAVTGQRFNLDTSGGPTLSITFNDDLGASFTPGDIRIVNSQTGVTLPASAYVATYSSATRTISLAFTGPLLPDGRYNAILDAGVVSGISRGPNAALSLPFSFIKGDADGNGSVNFDDLLVVAQNYGLSGLLYSQGNFNFSTDGLVSFDDLLVVSQRYGRSVLVEAPMLATTIQHRRRTLRTA